MLRTNASKLIGNSLKNDFSTGKDASFYGLKTNYKSSDFNNTSSASNYMQLLSLNSPATSHLYSNYNFGGNKLIARKATSLITSQKVLNLDAHYLNTPSTLLDMQGFTNNYANFGFDSVYPTKPNYTNHQLVFFSSLSNFQNALNFMNINDLKIIYSQSTNLNYDVSSLSAQENKLLAPSLTDSFIFNLSTLPLFTYSTSFLENGFLKTVESFKTMGQLKTFKMINSFFLITGSSPLPFALVADQDF